MLSGRTDPGRQSAAQPRFGETRSSSRWQAFIPSRIAALLLFLGILIPEAVTFQFMGTDTPVWLTNAVGVATLLRNAPTKWPGLILIQVTADTAASVFFGDGFEIGFGAGVCDMFEILAVSTALHSIHGNEAIFASLGRILKFAAICMVVPALTACVGAVMLHVVLRLPYQEAWRTWYLSAMFGLLIVTPFLCYGQTPGVSGACHGGPWQRSSCSPSSSAASAG